MGLLTGLLTLPLAPVRGVVWLSERLVDMAEEELFGEEATRDRMRELEEMVEQGALTEEQFEEEWEALVVRLIERRGG